ncbi:MAG: tryptophan--tRNA ligase [Mycoplasma sp.]
MLFSSSKDSKINKKVMVSGIQPTNNLTLGNYLGAIENFVRYQEEYNMYVFVADLHAITTNQDINIKDNKYNIVKHYIAAGLDPKKVVIFNQSDILEHTLLGHILLCHTTIGELSRMTQFKDKSNNCKSSNGTDFIPTGLLTYPALMAADILLYDAEIVIVGQDQKQHLELTRNLATRLNNLYKQECFVVPEFQSSKITSKVMDLLEPTKKMSKSSPNPKGTIFLNDAPEVTAKKIMGALTDNLNSVKFDIDNQPGISNLMAIYSALTKKTMDEIESEFKGAPNYGVFKKAVADEVSKFIINLQSKVNSISNEQVIEILEDGFNKSKPIATDKVNKILKLMRMK